MSKPKFNPNETFNESFDQSKLNSAFDQKSSSELNQEQEESSLKIPLNERIAITEEIESLLLMTFKTFDENRSGEFTRVHRLQRTQTSHQKHGLQKNQKGNKRDFQGNRQGRVLEFGL